MDIGHVAMPRSAEAGTEGVTLARSGPEMVPPYEGPTSNAGVSLVVFTVHDPLWRKELADA